MSAKPLPRVRHELFLALDGLVGLRCRCGFLATGRSAEAVDATMSAHARAVHLDEDVSEGDEHTT